jgi:hypothetical protein
MKIILDTAKGGYRCWGCQREFTPEEPQVILGDEDQLWAVCKTCLDSGYVALWELPPSSIAGRLAYALQIRF